MELEGIELLTSILAGAGEVVDNQLFSNTSFVRSLAPLDWTLPRFGAVLVGDRRGKGSVGSAPGEELRGFGWCKATHTAWPDTGERPMKTTNSRRTQTAKQPLNASKARPAPLPADLPRPGGKLGDILVRVAAKNGATAEELVDATGWQKHSVLGALSKLKSRGFAIRLDAKSNRKAYRLVSAAS